MDSRGKVKPPMDFQRNDRKLGATGCRFQRVGGPKRTVRRQRRFDHRAGATAVEFALIFPIILTFFVASMAFTQAFMLRDTAQHAAYKGVRRGIVWNATTADVQAEVQGFLSQLGIRDAVITTEPAVIDNNVPTIRVNVSIPMNRNAWVASPFMPSEFAPSSSVALNRPNDQ